MLQNIPTHVIAGPLGAGKTTLIGQLLKQKPDGERWAVLINEFGQIGLDEALLGEGAQGVTFSEIPGGCLCCVNGAPFQVGLARLLRKAKPDRLFIEPSGLGHPLAILQQLRAAPWVGVLAVQPLVMVVRREEMAVQQREAMAVAGLVVARCDPEQAQWVSETYPQATLLAAIDPQVDLLHLPISIAAASTLGELPEPTEASAKLSTVWQSVAEPVLRITEAQDRWSIGWQWHPHQLFDADALGAWLASVAWLRAKIVIHSTNGWQSGNWVEGVVGEWQPSEWRRDSRLELIFDQPQDQAHLREGLQRCQVPG